MQETQETWVRSLDQEDPLEKGIGNPLQHSYLENPMDREAWWVTAHRAEKRAGHDLLLNRNNDRVCKVSIIDP